MRILLFFIFLSISLPLSAQEWTFSTGLTSQYINGEIQELVYDWHDGERYTMSALYWEIENLFLAGPWAQINRGPFQLKGEFLIPLNEGTGQMQDYDWLGYTSDFASLGLTNPEEEWTHYSRSDVFIKKYLDYTIDLSYKAFTHRFFEMDITAGFQYRQIRWEDIPLYYIYSTSSSFRGSSGNFIEDNAINFEWHSSTGLAGLNFWFIPSPYNIPELQFRLQGQFGFYSYRYTVDEHILRNYQFTDIFAGAIQWDLNASVEYLIGNSIFLSLQYGWSIYPLKDQGTESWTHYLNSGILQGYSENSVGSKAYLYHFGITIAYQY